MWKALKWQQKRQIDECELSIIQVIITMKLACYSREKNFMTKALGPRVVVHLSSVSKSMFAASRLVIRQLWFDSEWWISHPIGAINSSPVTSIGYSDHCLNTNRLLNSWCKLPGTNARQENHRYHCHFHFLSFCYLKHFSEWDNFQWSVAYIAKLL